MKQKKVNTHFDAAIMGSRGVSGNDSVFALLTTEVQGTADTTLIFGFSDESCIASSGIDGVLTMLIFFNSLVGAVRVMRVFVNAVSTLFSLSPSPINTSLHSYV